MRVNQFLNLAFVLFIVDFVTVTFNNCQTKFQKHCQIFFIALYFVFFNLFVELN